jgi:hypothetical protein
MPANVAVKFSVAGPTGARARSLNVALASRSSAMVSCREGLDPRRSGQRQRDLGFLARPDDVVGDGDADLGLVTWGQERGRVR